MPRFPSIRGAIPAWTPKHLQKWWPGQKRTSQNGSARQKRRNSAHRRPFYFGATNRTSRHVNVRGGGLLSYGTKRLDNYRRAASYVIAFSVAQPKPAPS